MADKAITALPAVTTPLSRAAKAHLSSGLSYKATVESIMQWELVAEWADYEGLPASEIVVADLGDYNEITVIVSNLYKSVSASIGFQVSADNGATFYSAFSGDYASIGTDGVESAVTGTIYGQNGNTTGRRGFVFHVAAWNIAQQKYIHVSPGELTGYIFLQSVALNAIKIVNNNGVDFIDNGPPDSFIQVFGR